MSRRILCTLFAILALFASRTWAQSQIRIVRLSYVEGDVQLDRNDGQGFSKAFLNLPIVAGDRVSTGTDSYAEAQLEDGSTIRLTPNGLMEFPQLDRDNNGTQTTVTLKQGEAYFRWKQNHDDVLRVLVGEEGFTPKKKSHFRVSVTDADSAVAVFDGKLEMFRRNGQRTDIGKNETLSLSSNDPDRYFLTRAVQADPQDDWDHDRQADVDRVDAAQANSNAYLSQYGTYVSTPDYGSLWRPTGFGYDWDPYQDGSWAWYPSTGYVWVSSYPWGWAPYRYGSWVFVNNLGWCWRPSPYGNTWNTGPILLHGPGGFRPPLPPIHHRDGIIAVGRPASDFDNDHRWHHAPTVVGATTPASSTNTANRPTNGVITDSRPERSRRDGVATTNSEEPAAHRGGDARPLRTPTPATAAPATVATPAASPQPRPDRSERLPSQPRADRSERMPSQPAPAAHSYSPPPRSEPAPAPHYSPPPPPSAPPQSAPAPRSEPPAGRSESGGRVPK